MPRQCAVPGCGARQQKGIPVSFHQFPSDETLARKWKSVINRDEAIHGKLTDNMKVCSRHFLKSDYYPNMHTDERLKLLTNSVPSLRLNLVPQTCVPQIFDPLDPLSHESMFTPAFHYVGIQDHRKVNRLNTITDEIVPVNYFKEELIEDEGEYTNSNNEELLPLSLFDVKSESMYNIHEECPLNNCAEAVVEGYPGLFGNVCDVPTCDNGEQNRLQTKSIMPSQNITRQPMNNFTAVQAMQKNQAIYRYKPTSTSTNMLLSTQRDKLQAINPKKGTFNKPNTPTVNLSRKAKCYPQAQSIFVHGADPNELNLLENVEIVTVEVGALFDEEEEEEQRCPVRERCRLCAGSSGDMVAIFSNEGHQASLHSNINQFMPITVCEGDTLPLRVCAVCVARLEACQQLAEQCTRANSQLRRSLAQEQQRAGPRETPEVHTKVCDSLGAEMDTTQEQEIWEPSIESIQKPPIHRYYSRKNKSNKILDPAAKPVKKYPRKSKQTRFLESEIRCKSCDFKSSDTLKFQLHMLSHNGSWWCKVCHKCFPTESDLNEHKFDEHLLVCQFCNDRFNELDFMIHVRKMHKEALPKNIKMSNRTYYEGVKCKLCSSQFARQHTLKNHYFWKHMKYACDICLQLFLTSEEQVEHTEEVHMIPCAFCSAKHYSHHRLKRHVNKQHKEQSAVVTIPGSSQQAAAAFQCQFCNKGLTSKASVCRHYYWSHFQYTCPVCLQAFKSAELEDKHSKCHGNICLCCEEKFQTESLLSEHLSSRHPDLKPFSCESCGESFSTRPERNSHRLEHKAPEKYLCDQCGKGFKTASILLQHRYTHKSEAEKGKVECEYCNKKFVFKSQLSSHLLKHTRQKLFKCLDCNISFINANALHNHMESHSKNIGKKKHKCDFCNLRFISKPNLKLHVNGVHSSSSVYKCCVCSKICEGERDIQLHVSFHTHSELSQFKESYLKISEIVCAICNQYFSNKITLISHVKKHLRHNLKTKCKKH